WMRVNYDLEWRLLHLLVDSVDIIYNDLKGIPAPRRRRLITFVRIGLYRPDEHVRVRLGAHDDVGSPSCRRQAPTRSHCRSDSAVLPNAVLQPLGIPFLYLVYVGCCNGSHLDSAK